MFLACDFVDSCDLVILWGFFFCLFFYKIIIHERVGRVFFTFLFSTSASPTQHATKNKQKNAPTERNFYSLTFWSLVKVWEGRNIIRNTTSCF